MPFELLLLLFYILLINNQTEFIIYFWLNVTIWHKLQAIQGTRWMKLKSDLFLYYQRGYT